MHKHLQAMVLAAHEAVRVFRGGSAFAVVVVGTLTVGIGSAAALFAVVDAVLLRPLPYYEADRLVAIRHAASRVELPLTGLSPGTFLHYRRHNRAFAEIGVYMDKVLTLTDPDPEQIRVAQVSPSTLSVLGLRPVVGRLPTARDFDLGVRTGVLISHGLWARRYGSDPAIVGRSIGLERVAHAVVTGVAAPGFHFPHPETQAWLVWPQEAVPGGARAALDNLYMKGVGRLREGVSLSDAETDLKRLVASIPEALPDVTAARIQEMGLQAVVAPLKDEIVGDVRTALEMLLGAAAFVFLVAVANVTSLALVRAEGLRRVVAVATALGASRRRLAGRFLLEGLMLGALGGVFGLVLAYAAVSVRFGFAPDGIPRLREVVVGVRVLGLVAILAVCSGLLLAAAPLPRLLRVDLAPTLAGALGRLTAGRDQQLGRRVLVAFQVALALPLLVGSALMAQSFWRLRRAEVGFRPEEGLTFSLSVPPARGARDYYREAARVHADVLDRLRRLPTVLAAEAATIFPLTPRVPFYDDVRVTAAERGAADNGQHALLSFATPGYFEAMGIPLLHGRLFETRDMSHEAPSVMLSRRLALALFRDSNAVGRQVRWPGDSRYPPYTVVGVVGDVAADGIRDDTSSILYFPHVYPPAADTVTGAVLDYIPDGQVYVMRTPSTPAALGPAIRQAVSEVDPRLVVTRLGTLDGLVAAARAPTRLTMVLLIAAAGIAVLLGMVGLYGMLSHAVSQRRSELALRMALGAAPGGVVWMLVRQGVAVVFGGIAVGVMASLGLVRYMRSLVYQVSPDDPSTMVATVLLLCGVAGAASYLPARRASEVKPATLLRGG